MKKIRLSYLRWAILFVLFSFVLFASISSEVGEMYAVFIYPRTSEIISAISSLIPFSLDELTVLAFIFLLLGYPFYARLKSKRNWLHILGKELEFIAWVYVWFYWGWGMNYYRANFYQRAEVKPVAYNQERFDNFLVSYSKELSQAYADCVMDGWMQHPDLYMPVSEGVIYVPSESKVRFESENSQKEGITAEIIRDEIRSIFQSVPLSYGLTQPHSYQYPKKSFFNALYSNVGVLGFMGPFWDESHVNEELSLLEYPFTYAHELSHLLGVSSEAEANLWAYTICFHSTNSLVRLSGYLGMLSYVRSNAFYLLSSQEFDQWESSLSPNLIAAFYRIHTHWMMRYNKTLGEVQSVIYDFYLRRNKIASGQKNYAQVVGMLLALPNYKLSFHP